MPWAKPWKPPQNASGYCRDLKCLQINSIKITVRKGRSINCRWRYCQYFIAAQFSSRQVAYEADLIEEAQRLIAAAKQAGSDIPIPVDVVCAKEFSETAIAT